MEKLEIENLVISDYINKLKRQTRLILRNEFCKTFTCTNYTFNKKNKENSFSKNEIEFIFQFIANYNAVTIIPSQYFDLKQQQKMNIRTKFCCSFECSEPTFYYKLRHGFKKSELEFIHQLIVEYGKV